jgi:hypothetical protein
MLKVAQYCAQLENYERAIQIYEQVQKSIPQWKQIDKQIHIVPSGPDAL